MGVDMEPEPRTLSEDSNMYMAKIAEAAERYDGIHCIALIHVNMVHSHTPCAMQRWSST